jgi:hypothetical protein
MENIKISNKNEQTRDPFWIIIDPRQNFNTNEDGIYNIANMITGVFFSRESATEYLRVNPHHYSKNAKVFCHSGCYSKDWIELSKQITENE